MLRPTYRKLRESLPSPYRHKPIKDPVLYMTILAKNEIEVIEKNLVFHKAMGVDGFVVTDNNSNDGTREVFEKYRRKGWIRKVIDEPANDNFQVKWVDRMAKCIVTDYHADWIINADADEFWVPTSGNLKTELTSSSANVIRCPIHNILPANEARFYENNLMVMRQLDSKLYGLAAFNSFGASLPKVIHRTEGYQSIHMGNHDVNMERKRAQPSTDVMIYHFNIRSCEHFKRKMLVGGAGLEKNTVLDKSIGAHMRYFFNGVARGELDMDKEYERFIGRTHWELFEQRGIITEANSIKEFFKHEEY
jgi:glycosyltransferase involved in cell wall biosynthesis